MANKDYSYPRNEKERQLIELLKQFHADECGEIVRLMREILAGSATLH